MEGGGYAIEEDAASIPLPYEGRGRGGVRKEANG